MPNYVSSTALTLVDWLKRLDPEGRISPVAEILNQQNDMLDDMLWTEGNLPTGHRTTLRTSIPNILPRSLNVGSVPTKSTTAQIEDTASIFQVYSEIDRDLCELNGNTAEFRLSEDKPFMESMNQTVAATLLYGNAKFNPLYFTGFMPRFNTVQTTATATANNVLDAGGTASTNTSILLVVWGENTVSGFFPKGSKGGLEMEDKGVETIYDANLGRYEAYRTRFAWKCGLTVRDWRFVVRIANIDVTQLPVSGTLGSNNQPNLSGKADLITLIQRAFRKIPNMGMGRPALYMNRAVASAIDIQAANRPNVLRSVEDVMGKRYDTFQGVPMRITDQMLSTEARVV